MLPLRILSKDQAQHHNIPAQRKVYFAQIQHLRKPNVLGDVHPVTPLLHLGIKIQRMVTEKIDEYWEVAGGFPDLQ